MTERKSGRRGLFPLILGAILLAVGLIGAHGEDALLQYAVRAPQAQSVREEDKGKISPNAALKALTERLDTAWEELAESVSLHALHGSAGGVSLTAEGGSTVEAALTAADGDYFALYPKLLTAGRLIYPEEMKYGERVMVLDEGLAIALFAVSDPIDREVRLYSETYRVVGVVRHGRSVGDADEYGAYVPLRQVEKEDISLDMLVATALPLPQSGALSAFTLAMESWQAGGSVYDLDKEAMRAGILARLVLCGAALYLILALFRWLNGHSGARIGLFREELRSEYLRVLLPALLRDGALLLLGYAAALAACAGLTVFALQPVYVFPEWIPAVLVEWTDIRDTFWNLAGAAARPFQCVTPEMARIRFCSIVGHWGLISLLFGAGVLVAHR